MSNFLRNYQLQFKRALIAPVGTVDVTNLAIAETKIFDAASRFGVYHEGYNSRLHFFLDDNSILLRERLGDAWEVVAAEYLAMFPPDSTCIHDIGDRMPDFLRRDLGRFHADDVVAAERDRVRAESMLYEPAAPLDGLDDFLEGRAKLSLHASVRIYSGPAATTFFVRSPAGVAIEEVANDEVQALKRVLEPVSVDELLATLETLGWDESRVQSFFERFAELGAFVIVLGSL